MYGLGKVFFSKPQNEAEKETRLRRCNKAFWHLSLRLHCGNDNTIAPIFNFVFKIGIATNGKNGGNSLGKISLGNSGHFPARFFVVVDHRLGYDHVAVLLTVRVVHVLVDPGRHLLPAVSLVQ